MSVRQRRPHLDTVSISTNNISKQVSKSETKHGQWSLQNGMYRKHNNNQNPPQKQVSIPEGDKNTPWKK